MKQIFYLLLLSVFLASCANTATSLPAFTETSISTATLAITDTPQPTLTEIPAPKPPEGATEFNTGRGLWKNAEGKFYIPELRTWLEALNKGEIHAIDASVYPTWFMDGINPDFQSFPINYYRLPGAEVIFNSFEETPGYSEQYTNRDDIKLSSYPFQSDFAWLLSARVNDHENSKLNPGEVNAALKAMQNGKLLIALDIPMVAYDNSATVTKSFDPNKGIRIVQVPFSMTEGDKSYFGQRSEAFRWKVDVIDEQLVEYITMKGLLSDQFKAELPLIPLAAALFGQQMPTLEFIGTNAQDANAFFKRAQELGMSQREFEAMRDEYLIFIGSGALVSENEKAVGQTLTFIQIK